MVPGLVIIAGGGMTAFLKSKQMIGNGSASEIGT
jgi:hypothetical protein